jgi:hypothetical protein
MIIKVALKLFFTVLFKYGSGYSSSTASPCENVSTIIKKSTFWHFFFLFYFSLSFSQLYNTYSQKMTLDAYSGIKTLYTLITDVFFREIKVR